MPDPGVTVRTIVVSDQIVGYVSHFRRDAPPALPEVSYELGPQHWGRGYASAALGLFLREIEVRPLYARVAKDNAASLRVLKKCAFVVVGEDQFLGPDGRAVAEFIFALDP